MFHRNDVYILYIHGSWKFIKPRRVVLAVLLSAHNYALTNTALHSLDYQTLVSKQMLNRVNSEVDELLNAQCLDEIAR